MTITFSQLGSLGRCGNSIFQCCAIIGTAIANRTDFLFPRWQYEKDFCLPDCFTSHPIKKGFVYQEPYFQYAKPPSNQDMEMVGYFQSYKYFEHCDDYIRQCFEFREPIEPTNATAIHVRRTDYLTLGNDYHPVLPMNYYMQAMSMIGSSRYIVFSDDIAWCKNAFRGNQFEFAENGSPIEDLKLMTSCENQIIANSSFSWWAAYLNKNQNKRVIAPQHWFGKKLGHDTKDLCPMSWERI